jgi:hypothetical protein
MFFPFTLPTVFVRILMIQAYRFRISINLLKSYLVDSSSEIGLDFDNEGGSFDTITYCFYPAASSNKLLADFLDGIYTDFLKLKC